MSSDPSFASTVVVGAKLLTTEDASFTAPSNVQTIITGGDDGTKIDEILVQANATLAAGVVNLWLHDGANYFLIDQFLLAATPAMSTTAPGFQARRAYTKLLVPDGWTLRASHTVNANASKVLVVATGGEF